MTWRFFPARRSAQPCQSEGEDRGLIEPQDHCGLLPLTVIRRGDADFSGRWRVARGSPLAQARLPGALPRNAVISLPISAPACSWTAARRRGCGLTRSGSRTRASWNSSLNFCGYTLESPAFRAAVDEVLRNPHRRLEDEREERDISRPFKPGRDFARQVAVAARRVSVPKSHPLHATIQSLPARVSVSVAYRLSRYGRKPICQNGAG